MLNKECIMRKGEPWNSVLVTFSIPKEAANTLARLAHQNDDHLKQLGILSVQVQGEDTVRHSVSNSGGNIQRVIVQQPQQVQVSCALTQSSADLAHGDGPHEFDTILSQLKASGLQPTSSGYLSSVDHNVFVVPQQTTRKRNKRKSKEKVSSRSGASGIATALMNSTPNGRQSVRTAGAHGFLAAGMDTSTGQQTSETLTELGDMGHLDINDLIGADGSLDHLDIGGKNYSNAIEKIADILHIDDIDPQRNTTLGMSPSSLSANQAQSQMNNSLHLSEHASASEMDELINQLHGFEAEEAHSTNQLSQSIGDVSYSQGNSFDIAAGPSPVMQRQMSFPQYSSKQGPMHGPNSQGMFSPASGRQSVGPINTGLASPHHPQQHLMANPGSDTNIHMAAMLNQGNVKGNMVSHHPDITGKVYAGMENDIGPGFSGFSQTIGLRGQDMAGMPKQPLNNRPPSAGMMQSAVANAWKMPPGATASQHLQLNTMHQSPGMPSPKPMNSPISSAGAYNPPLTPTKRGYPGPATTSQFHPQQPGTMDVGKSQGASMASPLLVNLLQTSASTTTAGVMVGQQVANPQLTGTQGEPKPKRKKAPRRKKPSKNSYQPATPDGVVMAGSGMVPGAMPPHMSAQHAGIRMQQSQFGSQYGMQPGHSPGQYFHPHAQSPLSQMHTGMTDGQKGMYVHFPNGTNMPSPSLHQMGNKVSPSHAFSPDQKTAYIETINRSDVGSRLSSGTPTQMGQTRVPTPGHSPSGHGPSSFSVGPGMFMGNISSTVHHGPRVPGMNGMHPPMHGGHMQATPRMPQQGMPGMHGGANARAAGHSPGMQNSQMMGQQFQMQPQTQFHPSNVQFQSTPVNMHANAAVTMYNQGRMKPKHANVVMASPGDYNMQEVPPPNVVINRSDAALQQAIASQRPVPGYQKRMGPGDQAMAMQNVSGVQAPGTFYHQRTNSSPGHMAMKGQNNPAYYNPGTQIPVAGPNNFNNSNSLDTSAHLSGVPASLTGVMSTPGGMSEEMVALYQMSMQPKPGVLESGESSVLLKGSCNSVSAYVPPLKAFAANAPAMPDASSHKPTRFSKKSPGSATDGHSSSPGSSFSHSSSPATVKRSLSTSNPPTPMHLDSIGSPASMTMQSHPDSRSTTPRQKSGGTTPRSRSGTPVGATSTPGHGNYSGPHQRGLHQGPLTPTLATPNGTAGLKRPVSRSDSNQLYMASPSTPGHLRLPFQTPPAYSQISGAPSPMAVSLDSSHPAMALELPGYGSLPPAYPRDHIFSTQHLPQQVTADPNVAKTPGSNEGTSKSPWTQVVANHHPSPSIINSPSSYESNPSLMAQRSQNVTPAPTTQTMPNLSGGSGENKQNLQQDSVSQNCINDKPSSAGVVLQPMEVSSSPGATPVDLAQTQPRHGDNSSPHFFNNSETPPQDLLASGKTKTKQGKSTAPTVSLQS